MKQNKTVKVGVFDSGVGGKYFVDAIKYRFPGVIIIYKEDRKNIPYGNKTASELFKLTLPIFKSFEDEKCDIVVVACNTVTTNIIDKLRNRISVPLVGVEPMIKAAAKLTRSNSIAVCATPATLNSAKYHQLKVKHAVKIAVLEPDCSTWASMIDQNKKNTPSLEPTVEQIKKAKADVVVLGCTHYHWIQEKLQNLTGKEVQVIQPTEPVLDRLQDVAKGLGLSI